MTTKNSAIRIHADADAQATTHASIRRQSGEVMTISDRPAPLDLQAPSVPVNNQRKNTFAQALKACGLLLAGGALTSLSSHACQFLDGSRKQSAQASSSAVIAVSASAAPATSASSALNALAAASASAADSTAKTAPSVENISLTALQNAAAEKALAEARNRQPIWVQMANRVVYRHKEINLDENERGVVLMIETDRPEQLVDDGLRPVLTHVYSPSKEACEKDRGEGKKWPCDHYVAKYYTRCHKGTNGQSALDLPGALSSVYYQEEGHALAQYTFQVEMCSAEQRAKLAQLYAGGKDENGKLLTLSEQLLEKLLSASINILPSFRDSKVKGELKMRGAYLSGFETP